MIKRVKITKTGKLKRRSAFISHLLEKRSTGRKRRHQGDHDVSRANVKAVKKLIGA
jgi:large subunit ribosomal protein L35